MQLYVGNIPTTLTKEQLRDFFQGYHKNASFKIKRVKNEAGIFIYGLVEIPLESKAIKAIKRLNKKRIDGRLISVREFVYRASQNDRRALNWRTQKWLANERRNNERRTIKLRRDLEGITFAA